MEFQEIRTTSIITLEGVQVGLLWQWLQVYQRVKMFLIPLIVVFDKHFVVHSGLCPIALGTDGGGSIRIPAAACGVVGIKG